MRLFSPFHLAFIFIFLQFNSICFAPPDSGVRERTSPFFNFPFDSSTVPSRRPFPFPQSRSFLGLLSFWRILRSIRGLIGETTGERRLRDSLLEILYWRFSEFEIQALNFECRFSWTVRLDARLRKFDCVRRLCWGGSIEEIRLEILLEVRLRVWLEIQLENPLNVALEVLLERLSKKLS